MAGRHDLYVGRAGQLAAMSELLLRGYNVAIPEVDVGDDVLVVEDEKYELSRVQVKSSIAVPSRTGQAHAVKYLISRKQLSTPLPTELYYALGARIADRWEFVVIARTELYPRLEKRFRTDTLTFRLAYRTGSITGDGEDYEGYRNNWERYWPVLTHPPLPRRKSK